MYKLPVDKNNKRKVIVVDEYYRRDFYKYVESKQRQKHKKYLYRYFKDFYFIKFLILNVNKLVFFMTIALTALTFIFSTFEICVHFHLALFVSPIINVLTFLMTTNLNTRYSVLANVSQVKSAVFSQVCQLREWQRVFVIEKKTVFKLQNSLIKTAAQVIHYTQTINRKKRNEIEKYIYQEIVLYCKYIEELYRMKHFIKVALMFILMKTIREMMRQFNYLKAIRDYRAPLIVRAFIFSSLAVALVPMSLIIVNLTKEPDLGVPRVTHATVVGFVSGLIYGNVASLISVMHDPFGVDMDQVNMKKTLKWLKKMVEEYQEAEHNTILFKKEGFFDWEKRNEPSVPVTEAQDSFPNLQNHDFVEAHYAKLGKIYEKVQSEDKENAFDLDNFFKVMLI